MEELKNKYVEEVKLLQLFQKSFFYGLDFDIVDYETINKYNFMQKKLSKKIDEFIEIDCKEKIYKKYIEKYLNIKIKSKSNNNDYENYQIVINNERIKLVLEKFELGKKYIVSKQYGLNGYVVYTYKDENNNHILYQNVNNFLQFLEEYNDNMNSNIFKLEDGEYKYSLKVPYNLAYEAIVNCRVLDERGLNDFFEYENKKRKSTNSNEIKIKKETKKNIQNIISKMDLVYNKSKDLYNNMIDELLVFSNIQEILQNGRDIVSNLEEKELVNNNDIEISDLQLLKNQKLELIDIKNKTDEIIEKLQKILIN